MLNQPTFDQPFQHQTVQVNGVKLISEEQPEELTLVLPDCFTE